MWGKGIAKIMKRWYSRSHIVNKIAGWIAKKNPDRHDGDSPDVSLVDVMLVLSGCFSRSLLSVRSRSYGKSGSVAYVGVEVGGLSLLNGSGSHA